MKKILFVDDDFRIFQSLVEDLKVSYGFNVVFLTSAESVLETLNSSSFDILILDIMMPIPDSWSFDEVSRSSEGLSTGIVLYEKIRGAFPEIPILIYSAKKVQLTNEKKTVILQKPELPTTIVETINRMVYKTI